MMTNNFEATHLEKDRTNFNNFKGLTVIAVDDIEDILILITYILEIYGIQVLTATNAPAALEMIKQSQVDLLISDIAMPAEDGYWLIREVRNLTLKRKREIPAIAFSGYAKDREYEKALIYGYQSFLKKPSDLNYLVTEVTKLLKGYKENSLYTLVATPSSLSR